MNNTTIEESNQSNQVSTASSNEIDWFYTALTYVSLVIIAIGLIGNTVSFAIFRFHRHFKTMPSMVYLSFISITDSLSLLVWNLDHYLLPNHGFKLETTNEPMCRIMTFEQFCSLQASAFLLSVLTVDRFDIFQN